ncbi:hypothetical protein V6N11_063311 [Hibiscus sabdariffa]|uniref:Uncharacterized protein n=1 Tax=Hibiscus sabdariffa TaxID=183260 RepID=A0ABR2NGN0_9ROSI
MGMEALVTMFLSKSNVEGETRNQIDPTVNLGEPRVTSMAVDTNPSMSFPELQEPNRKYGKRKKLGIMFIGDEENIVANFVQVEERELQQNSSRD